jgi:hypothetical protein
VLLIVDAIVSTTPSPVVRCCSFTASSNSPGAGPDVVTSSCTRSSARFIALRTDWPSMVNHIGTTAIAGGDEIAGRAALSVTIATGIKHAPFGVGDLLRHLGTSETNLVLRAGRGRREERGFLSEETSRVGSTCPGTASPRRRRARPPRRSAAAGRADRDVEDREQDALCPSSSDWALSRRVPRRPRAEQHRTWERQPDRGREAEEATTAPRNDTGRVGAAVEAARLIEQSAAAPTRRAR